MTQVARAPPSLQAHQKFILNFWWTSPRDHGQASDRALLPLAHTSVSFARERPLFRIDMMHTALSGSNSGIRPMTSDFPRLAPQARVGSDRS